MNVSPRRFSALLLALAVVIAAVDLLHFGRWLPFISIDLRDYVLPWFRHILAHGRWHSLEASFANYSPPYIYLLCAVSVLARFAPAYLLIKLAMLPFLALASFAAWRVCYRLTQDRLRATAAAILIPFLPEVVMNTFEWGQCDILHTSLLLLAILLLLSDQSLWAMALLGIAVAVKLQVIFVAPAILALLLTRRLPWKSLAASAAAFALMLLPALAAGRPARSLLAIYGNQYGYYRALTMDAPNIYVPIGLLTQTHEKAIAKLGFLCAGVFCALLVAYCSRRPRLLSGAGLLFTLTAPLLVLPYLLPRMHERYFFAGACLLSLLALLRASLLIPAALLQVAVLLAYSHFLSGKFATGKELFVPFVLTTLALASFAVLFWREGNGKVP